MNKKPLTANEHLDATAAHARRNSSANTENCTRQSAATLNATEQETIYLLYKYLDDLSRYAALNAESLANNTSPQPSPKEREQFPSLGGVRGGADTDITSFRFLFENYISAISMSFQSEATENLQIMGLLETRMLDFKNVILLSVNEGVLPAGKTVNSFIPQDVKQHFGLQTYNGKDAVFSYHFYRLLQRAENIYLLYNLDAKKGNAEKSRFIYQLKNELNTFPNSEIIDEIISYPPVKSEAETPISIKKTDEVLAKLKTQTYSASSISTFLECELRFYFRYILELEDNNIFTIDDMLQGKTIGTVIHSVLETAVEHGRFKRMEISDIERLVSERMCSPDLNLSKEDLLYEKNHLVYQIIIKYIDAYLKHAQSFEEKVVIKNTEEKLEHKLAVRHSALDAEPPENSTSPQPSPKEREQFPSFGGVRGGQTCNDEVVTLKGIIDRIDLQNGITRIIDYKTGVVKDNELKIRDIEHAFDGDHTKAFQLLFYAYLYHKQYNTDLLEAEIVSFRKIRTPYSLSIGKEKQLSSEYLTNFEYFLIETIQSILNQDLPFTATTEIDRCNYCVYKDICVK